MTPSGWVGVPFPEKEKNGPRTEMGERRGSGILFWIGTSEILMRHLLGKLRIYKASSEYRSGIEIPLGVLSTFKSILSGG